MITAIRTWWALRRWRRYIAHFDAQILENRKAHKAIRHIEAARRSFVHDALRGRG